MGLFHVQTRCVFQFAVYIVPWVCYPSQNHLSDCYHDAGSKSAIFSDHQSQGIKRIPCVDYTHPPALARLEGNVGARVRPCL